MIMIIWWWLWWLVLTDKYMYLYINDRYWRKKKIDSVWVCVTWLWYEIQQQQQKNLQFLCFLGYYQQTTTTTTKKWISNAWFTINLGHWILHHNNISFIYNKYEIQSIESVCLWEWVREREMREILFLSKLHNYI